MPDGGAVSDEYSRKFKEIINNDLDTPEAISLMWQLIKDEKVNDADKKATISEFDKVLGLNIEKFGSEIVKKTADIPSEIRELAEKREIARKAKDWKIADELRDKITSQGYVLDDTEEGFIISRI